MTPMDTNGHNLGVFSVDVALALHFVSPHLSIYRNASSIGYASKIYLKWQAIQLAIYFNSWCVERLWVTKES